MSADNLCDTQFTDGDLAIFIGKAAKRLRAVELVERRYNKIKSMTLPELNDLYIRSRYPGESFDALVDAVRLKR